MDKGVCRLRESLNSSQFSAVMLDLVLRGYFHESRDGMITGTGQ